MVQPNAKTINRLNRWILILTKEFGYQKFIIVLEYMESGCKYQKIERIPLFANCAM